MLKILLARHKTNDQSLLFSIHASMLTKVFKIISENIDSSAMNFGGCC